MTESQYGNYQPPVDQLLTLGRPEGGYESSDWPDYIQKFGFTNAHIPELIRLAQDPIGLSPEGDYEDDFEEGDASFYGPIYAWRILGQLKAEAAIVPFIELIVEDKWDD